VTVTTKWGAGYSEMSRRRLYCSTVLTKRDGEPQPFICFDLWSCHYIFISKNDDFYARVDAAKSLRGRIWFGWANFYGSVYTEW
jgi:hypothetical protein